MTHSPNPTAMSREAEAALTILEVSECGGFKSPKLPIGMAAVAVRWNLSGEETVEYVSESALALLNAAATAHPATAGGKPGEGEMREVLLFASYCADDDPNCSDRRPCENCLSMSNIFRVHFDGAVYARELGEPAALTPTAQTAASEAAELREAVADAVRFARMLPPGLPIDVDLSEDGVVSIEATVADRDVLVVFTGDRDAAFSSKAPGGFYGPLVTEFKLGDAFPEAMADLKLDIDLSERPVYSRRQILAENERLWAELKKVRTSLARPVAEEPGATVLHDDERDLTDEDRIAYDRMAARNAELSRQISVPAPVEGEGGDLLWLRGQVFSLCEDTEDKSAAALERPDLADHEAGFYRGQKYEAKGIRRAIAEVVRCRIADRAAAPKANGVGTGEEGALADIAAERRRQVEAEGWTPEHDATHSRGEMAYAAACYVAGGDLYVPAPDGSDQYVRLWPWSQDWLKLTGRRRNLIKGLALGLAELERLDRTPTLSQGNDEGGR